MALTPPTKGPMAYTNPTLTELYTEFYFEPGAFGGPQILACAQSLASSGLSIVELTPSVPGPPLPGELAVRIRCWSPDKKRLAQLGLNHVIVNQIAPYSGWQEYLRHARSVIEAARATAQLVVQSISLRTADRLDVPTIEYRLGRYIVCDGTLIPTSHRDVREACDVSVGRGYVATDRSNRSFRIQARVGDPERAPEKMVIRLDTVFHDVLPVGEDPFVRLEALHEESNGFFEAVVTDETRVIMGGRS